MFLSVKFFIGQKIVTAKGAGEAQRNRKGWFTAVSVLRVVHRCASLCRRVVVVHKSLLRRYGAGKKHPCRILPFTQALHTIHQEVMMMFPCSNHGFAIAEGSYNVPIRSL